jgi:hypothetical protein
MDPQADTAAVRVMVRTAGAVRNADRVRCVISSPISALLGLDGGAKQLVPSIGLRSHTGVRQKRRSGALLCLSRVIEKPGYQRDELAPLRRSQGRQ